MLPITLTKPTESIPDPFIAARAYQPEQTSMLEGMVGLGSVNIMTGPYGFAMGLERQMLRLDPRKINSQKEYEAGKYFRNGLKWFDGMTESYADSLASYHDEINEMQSMYDRSPNGLPGLATWVAGTFGPELLNPFNYVGLGTAQKTALALKYRNVLFTAAKGGRTLSSLGQVRLGMAVGVGEVLAGATAETPFLFMGNRMNQVEFGADAIAMNYGIAVALGATFGSVGGWMSTFSGKRQGRILQRDATRIKAGEDGTPTGDKRPEVIRVSSAGVQYTPDPTPWKTGKWRDPFIKEQFGLADTYLKSGDPDKAMTVVHELESNFVDGSSTASELTSATREIRNRIFGSVVDEAEGSFASYRASREAIRIAEDSGVILSPEDVAGVSTAPTAKDILAAKKLRVESVKTDADKPVAPKPTSNAEKARNNISKVGAAKDPKARVTEAKATSGTLINEKIPMEPIAKKIDETISRLDYAISRTRAEFDIRKTRRGEALKPDERKALHETHRAKSESLRKVVERLKAMRDEAMDVKGPTKVDSIRMWERLPKAISTYTKLTKKTLGKVSDIRVGSLVEAADAAVAAGDWTPMMAKLLKHFASIDPEASAKTVVQIIDQIRLATPEMKAIEGIPLEKEAFVLGRTQSQLMEDGAVKTSIQFYRGANESTVVEEWYHGFWDRLSPERKAQFEEFWKANGSKKPIHEFFAKTGTDYFFKKGLYKAVGTMAEFLEKAKKSFLYFIKSLVGIKDIVIPKRIERMLREAGGAPEIIKERADIISAEGKYGAELRRQKFGIKGPKKAGEAPEVKPTEKSIINDEIAEAEMQVIDSEEAARAVDNEIDTEELRTARGSAGEDAIGDTYYTNRDQALSATRNKLSAQSENLKKAQDPETGYQIFAEQADETVRQAEADINASDTVEELVGSIADLVTSAGNIDDFLEKAARSLGEQNVSPDVMERTLATLRGIYDRKQDMLSNPEIRDSLLRQGKLDHQNMMLDAVAKRIRGIIDKKVYATQTGSLRKLISAGMRHFKALHAAFGGEEFSASGALTGTMNKQDVAGSAALSRFYGDVDRTVAPASKKMLESMELNLIVRRELHNMKRGGTPGSITGNSDAYNLAKSWRIAEETNRLDMVDAGAMVPEADMLSPHPYDQEKILGKEDDFVNDLVDKNDWEAAFDSTGWPWRYMTEEQIAAKKVEFAKAAYRDITTGNRDASMLGDESRLIEGEYKSSATRTHRRHVFFRTAELEDEFAKKWFKDQGIFESMSDEVRIGARTVVLIQDWGPNYKEMIETIRVQMSNEALAAGDNRSARIILSNAPLTGTKSRIDYMIGTDSSGSNPTMAKWFRITKALVDMTKLGKVFTTAITDHSFIVGTAIDNGIPLLDAQYKCFENHFRGKLSDFQKDTLEGIGLINDAQWGSSINRMREVDGNLTGKVGEAVKWAHGKFFWATGLNFTTMRKKEAFAFLLSWNLARSRGALDSIDPKLANTLKKYGIEDGEWNFYRELPTRTEDGKEFMTPDLVKNATVEQLDAYIASTGAVPTSVEGITAARNKAAYDLEMKLKTYLYGETNMAVPTPGSTERALISMGTRSGTIPGEVLRLATMYKIFSLTIARRHIPRIMHGSAGFHVGGAASLIVSGIVYGYVSNSIRDLQKNQTPMNPYEHPFKVAVAALERSGGAGIYGDVLFAKTNRMGQGIVEAFAGPAFGDITKAYSMFSNLKEGKRVTPQAWKYFIDHVPFMGLHGFRGAFDLMVGNDIIESLQPGSMNRIKQLQEEEGRTSLISR